MFDSFFHQGKKPAYVWGYPQDPDPDPHDDFSDPDPQKMPIRNLAVEIHKSIDFRCKNISIPTSSLTTSLAFSLAS